MYTQSIRLHLLELRTKILLAFIPDTVSMCFVCSETCSAGMVSCGPNATRPCIAEFSVCDGYNNCGDNRDEEDCGQLTTAIVITMTLRTHGFHDGLQNISAQFEISRHHVTYINYNKIHT